MLAADTRFLRRIKRQDRLARRVIAAGGVLVIATLLGLVVFIVGQTVPLFLPGRATLAAEIALPEDQQADAPRAVGVWRQPGDQRALLCCITGQGSFVVLHPQSGDILAWQKIEPPAASSGAHIRCVERHVGGYVEPRAGLEAIGAGLEGSRQTTSRYTLLWSSGAVSLVEIVPGPASPEKEAAKKGSDSGRAAPGALRLEICAQFEPGPHEVALAVARRAEVKRGLADTTQLTVARLVSGNRVEIVRKIQQRNLLGAVVERRHVALIEEVALGRITALTMDRNGQWLYAGTERGELARWQLGEDAQPVFAEVVAAFDDGRAITALAMVAGDTSLAAGDSLGQVTIWFPVAPPDGRPVLQRVHTLSPDAGPVVTLVPSARDKSLLALGAEGRASLLHTTTERRLLQLGAGQTPLRLVDLAPRSNAAVALGNDGTVYGWNLQVPHPETSFGALFGRVHYEGYPEPTFTWQSGGTDDYEPKLSLVPLIFGTLKATTYAMLFALPLALLAAVYTSQFAAPGFRRAVKPAVEIMAAFPSVVVGFLAALWLAPLVERWILAGLVAAAVVPLVLVAFLALAKRVHRWPAVRRLERGAEFLAMIPVVVAAGALAVALADPLENWLFGGSFKLWLHQRLGMQYDIRNAIVVGVALGFAVIPIIFSLAEDALSAVPARLIAASMALGATRWQTVWRVVLPSASPGIFAAAMIGFGRAVGETMIVLMAAGNTPILDFSPFNGMRTLAANIAVEIPEAPAEGTLYRVLFLCAVLLFLMTFVLNTAAELVRQALRQRFGRL